jgi:ABC-type lipoprotein export system ATPase subunit
MPEINITKSSDIVHSIRVKQLSAMFDVPLEHKSQVVLRGQLPIENIDWNVGLIVGPSGCGKSSIVKELFGDPAELDWSAASVIDDFPKDMSIQTISEVCQSVGFNTIPAWLRPYSVLSNGEKFRVEMARRLLAGDQITVVDEFTSVVDRQVAQIGSHAVQKHVRRNGLKFVASTCHFDVIDWLQPDWILEPATMTFTRRSLRQRPRINAEIRQVPYDFWQIFARYHYMSNELHRGAKCFCLFVDDRPVSIAAIMHFPHATAKDIMRCSRLVTLPDWQGLGLAMILIERLGAAYKGIGKRLRTYPAHPALIRSFAKDAKNWVLTKKPGTYNNSNKSHGNFVGGTGNFGGRPCATFEFKGEKMDAEIAKRLLL